MLILRCCFYQVLESLSENIVRTIISTIYDLITSDDLDLQLSGIRIMAVLINYQSIQTHKFGSKLVHAMAVTTTNILNTKESNVNKDRLLASWALANISSVLHLYRFVKI